MSRVPGTYSQPPNERLVTTPCRCRDCGELWFHMEIMPAEDSPEGPGAAYCMECGGRLEEVNDD
jgi:hypothetical protein